MSGRRTRACGNCAFYHDGEGVCLRYAPHPEMYAVWAEAVDHVDAEKGKGAHSVSPSVDPIMNWCGEWELPMADRKLGGWNPESGLFDG